MKPRLAFALMAAVGAVASCGGGSSTPVEVNSDRVVLPNGGSRVKASVADGLVSFDFSGLRLDRETHMDVGKSDGTVFVLVGHFDGAELPGKFVPTDGNRPKVFPPGTRSGVGPDTFATSGLTSGEYVACVSAVPAIEGQLTCTEFTIG